MARNVLWSLLLAFAGIGLFAVPGSAQSSVDNLGHYRLLPRYSTLQQSGGFAGRETDYLLSGKYDVLRSAPSGAKFKNAEVWGSVISPYPTVAMVFDIDTLLNLEGLQGQALPVAAPFDVYEFTGKIADGSSIRLYGSFIGPWMYLRGSTTPPPNAADYFTYQLKVLARTRPFADANNDGTVDAADYVMLRPNATALSADQPNLVDWFQQYGETIPDLNAYDAMLSAAVGSLAPAAAVPEPSLCVIAVLGLLAFRAQRRRVAARL